MKLVDSDDSLAPLLQKFEKALTVTCPTKVKSSPTCLSLTRIPVNFTETQRQVMKQPNTIRLRVEDGISYLLPDDLATCTVCCYQLECTSICKAVHCCDWEWINQRQWFVAGMCMRVCVCVWMCGWVWCMCDKSECCMTALLIYYLHSLLQEMHNSRMQQWNQLSSTLQMPFRHDKLHDHLWTPSYLHAPLRPRKVHIAFHIIWAYWLRTFVACRSTIYTQYSVLKELQLSLGNVNFPSTITYNHFWLA